MTQVDPVHRLYRLIRALGALGLLLLALGLGEFLYYEPLDQHTGAQAQVSGIFEYDPLRHTVVGEPRERFAEDSKFAAAVDWSTLPPGLLVDARWFDAWGNQVASTGPAAAALQPRVVPAPVAEGGNLPGEYVFVVERWQAGRPVELLARTSAVVRRAT